MNVLQEMKQFAKEAQELLASGKSLREVSRWSYAKREAGENVPYLGILDADEKNGVTMLMARPIVKQKELSEFFGEVAPGCKALKRYTIVVTNSGGVEFTERTGQKSIVRI